MTFSRLVLIAFAFALLCPVSADAKQWLSKRDARQNGFAYADQFADMLDPFALVHADMVPPRKCRRIDRVTVSCRFRVQLVSENRVVRSHVRVRLQRDGLFGILLPLDIWGNTAGDRSKRRGLGDF